MLNKKPAQSNQLSMKSKDFWKHVNAITFEDFIGYITYEGVHPTADLIPVKIENRQLLLNPYSDDKRATSVLICSYGNILVMFTPADICKHLSFEERDGEIIFANYYTVSHAYREAEVEFTASFLG